MEPTRVPVPTETRASTGTTNAYLVGERQTLLVDPATRTAALDEAVDDRQVEHVLVTHAHPDHVGAVAHYADRTGATVWARRGRQRRFERATGRRPDRTFAEGTVLGSVRVLDTPGHAPDHVALETDAGVLCGDLVLTSGSVVIDAHEGDMRAYLTALRRLIARDPPRLYPGHGSPIDDPESSLSQLLSRRLARERRVRSAIEEGAHDLDSILALAYDRDLTGVSDLARTTVAAHLEKLHRERRVDWNGTIARPP